MRGVKVIMRLALLALLVLPVLAMADSGSFLSVKCPEGLVISNNSAVDVFAVVNQTPSCGAVLIAVQNQASLPVSLLSCSAESGHSVFQVSGYSEGTVSATTSLGSLSSNCIFSTNFKKKSNKTPDLDAFAVIFSAAACAFVFLNKK